MQAKLVRLYATKLKLLDMLLGFLEWFSLGEKKKILYSSYSALFWYGWTIFFWVGKKNTAFYSELLWSLPLPISLNFFNFLEIGMFTHYCLMHEMSENQFDAHFWGFILCTEYNMRSSVLKATVCVRCEEFLELHSALERKMYFCWDRQAFFLR